MKKRTLAFCALLLCLFTLTACSSVDSKLAPDANNQFTLYITLLDKDTGTQVVSMEDAKKITTDILDKNELSYTMLDATGSVFADGKATPGQTIVVQIVNKEEDPVIEAIKAMKTSLNTSSVFVTATSVQSGLYTASN